MEREQDVSKAFNDGYKLARYSPEIADMLNQNLTPHTEYQKAIMEGIQAGNEGREHNRLGELNVLRGRHAPEQERDR